MKNFILMEETEKPSSPRGHQYSPRLVIRAKDIRRATKRVCRQFNFVQGTSAKDNVYLSVPNSRSFRLVAIPSIKDVHSLEEI